MEENKIKIRAFLLQYIRNEQLQDDEDIFATGAVNSLFAMQLVLFVENEFGMNVEGDDLTLDNFRSIQALATFIENKQSVTTP